MNKALMCMMIGNLVLNGLLCWWRLIVPEWQLINISDPRAARPAESICVGDKGPGHCHTHKSLRTTNLSHREREHG